MTHDLGSVLLHIGYHKTATTWLQNQLFQSGNRVFEPLSREPRGHSTLARRFVFDDEGYLLSPFDYNEESIHAEIEHLLATKPELRQKVAVMSHERLSGNPHAGGFDAGKIGRMLHRTFHRGRVLIVIRNQKDFLLSNYFQYLKIGGSFNLEKYLTTTYDGKRPFFAPHHVDYVPLVSFYMDRFGRDHVLVLPYELFKTDPNAFLTELAKFVDSPIEVDSERFDERMNTKKNLFVDYHLRSLNVLRRASSINNYSVCSTAFTKAVGDSIIRTLAPFVPDGAERSLEAKLRERIAEWMGHRYRDSNENLSRLIGRRLHPFGYD